MQTPLIKNNMKFTLLYTPSVINGYIGFYIWAALVFYKARYEEVDQLSHIGLFSKEMLLNIQTMPLLFLSENFERKQSKNIFWSNPVAKQLTTFTSALTGLSLVHGPLHTNTSSSWVFIAWVQFISLIFWYFPCIPITNLIFFCMIGSKEQNHFQKAALAYKIY